MSDHLAFLARVSSEYVELPVTQRTPGQRDDEAPLSRCFEHGEIVGGHYEIGARIGKGGMAQVYRARDLVLDRLVAIKSAWPWAADSLRREGRILASMHYEGVVQILATGDHLGLPYLVLENLEGESLAQRMIERSRHGRQCFTVDDALAIGVSLCDALAPLHARSIAHLDLKPGNIMFAGGRVVLIDLGIAWDAHNHAQRMSGSPHFIAPEAILDTLEMDRAHLADIYAVGVVLFCCIAGRPPFSDGEASVVMKRQVDEEPLSLDALCEKLPPRLAWLISSMLARDPKARPQSVERLKAALLGIPRIH